jgi:hypothetical protein
MNTRVFLTVDGQNDNIGDSILRRGVLKTFQGVPGVELHVNIGPRVDGRPEPHRGAGNDERYMTAVGLDGTEITYDSSQAWYRAAGRAILNGRVVLVQHAGERHFSKPRPWTGWRSVLGAVGARTRGGAAVQVGASAAITMTHVPLAERIACRLYEPVVWRDFESVEVFRTGEVMPDFAFGEGPDPKTAGLGLPPSERRFLAVSMRGDRAPLSAQKLDVVRSIAADRNLEIQVFTQVRRDAEGALRLSEELHPERPPILFGDEAHDVWERKVRALFSQSAVVASDRAHGVIIAATEGAIPLPLAAGDATKAARLIRPAGFDAALTVGRDMQDYLDQMFSDSESVSRRIAGARERLDAVRSRLRALSES